MLDAVLITNLSTGAPITAQTFSTVTIGYYYSNGSTVTHSAAVTMTKGTWASNGFVEVDATNAPGLYQIGIPNAALSGAAGLSVYVIISGITGQAPCVKEYDLVANDPATGAVASVAGAVGSVTANVTVGGYATGEDPASLVLATPANKIATDASGNVSVSGSFPTVTAIATAILDTPGTPLVTDGSGHIIGSSVLGPVGSVAGNIGGSMAGSIGGNVNGSVLGSVNAVESAVQVDLTQAVPWANTTDTVGEALHAARLSGLGDLIVNTTALTESLMESDGTTPGKVWSIDSATAPTKRVS